MLRRATVEDAPSIADIFGRSFGTLRFLPTLHTPEEDRAHFTRLVAEHEVWVAERYGRIVGFAVIQGDELTHLYVEPEEHGRRVGTALLDLVKQERPEGFRLWVFQKNLRARQFYERRDCRLLELTDGRGNEEQEPDALYEWRPG
jgi:ribosomal protein S18 acetylase RimI-like enzyme